MSSSRLRALATRVLALFVATICITLLAPVVGSPDYAMVCSAQGNHRIALGHVGDASTSQSSGSHGDPSAHCPLCMPAGAPPTIVAWDFIAVQPPAHVRHAVAAARLASLVGAPFPARGPPPVS